MRSIKYATLITGGSKRIGKSICKKLASENKNIIIHYYKSKKEATVLSNELNKMYNVTCITVKANLNNINQVKIFLLFLKKNQSSLIV